MSGTSSYRQLKASLVYPQAEANLCFDASSPDNRDGSFAPLIALRKLLGSHGIELNTADLNAEGEVAFELHLNAHATQTPSPCYLLSLETPLIHPPNGDPKNWRKYRRIFTWDDTAIDNVKFVKINFPNTLAIPDVDGFRYRDRFCCIIAGNKSSAVIDDRELYSERVQVIRWFERNAPSDFDLYGTDWDLPPAFPGRIGRVMEKASRLRNRYMPLGRPFPSYRGRVTAKKTVLSATRFSFCYENVQRLSGYVTEKIFDCFFSGCVPVYLGADNIADHVPADCFVDRRNFSDIADTYRYLKAMEEPTFRGFQERIASFLASDAARPFSTATFAQTIVDRIIGDLQADGLISPPQSGRQNFTTC
ncbi:glycosyltransferase family 10 domain-containing protein [Noviherbaspirillum sp.]|uniref:glycosyltransferase family 10 domain-containing protein n=1 Tax=Noviherbaspirillum sp. TaxID=1926288 RepID=UPI002FE174A8